MLAYVPIRFDLYRQLPARLWPVMAVLVAHCDRAGVCWPSLRLIARLIGVPKSTVGRYLAELARGGHLSRSRKPGGVYTYRIGAEWLPGHRGSVSHCVNKTQHGGNPGNDCKGAVKPRDPIHRSPVPTPARGAVPRRQPEEKSIAKKSSPAAVPAREPLDSEAFKQRARLRQWREFGRWCAAWGPVPGEAGCRAPQHLGG